MTQITKYLFASSMAALACHASAANIILNGDFETATSSGSAGSTTASELGDFSYATSGGGANGLSSVGLGSWTSTGSRVWYIGDGSDLLGEGSSNNLVRLDGNSAGGVDTLNQAALSLTAGQTVALGLTAFAEELDTKLFATLSNGVNTIDLLGATGATIVSTDSATQSVNSGALAVAATGTYTLTIWADQVSGNNHVYIDNVTLDAVTAPEPSSTTLFGLGGLVLIMRRRK